MTTKTLGRLVAILFWSSTTFAQTKIQPSQINGAVALKNAFAEAALYVSTAGNDSNDE